MENISDIEARVLAIVDSWYPDAKQINTVVPEKKAKVIAASFEDPHYWSCDDFETNVINSPEQHKKALEQLEAIWNVASLNTPEGNEFERLAQAIHSYEEKHYPVGSPIELCRCGCNLDEYIADNACNFGHFEDHEVADCGCGEIFISTGIYKWSNDTYHHIPEDKQLQSADVEDTKIICAE